MFLFQVMNINKLMRLSLLTLAILMGASMIDAANVDMNTARTTASNFLRLHSTSPTSLKAPALADLRLAHAEPSTVGLDAKAYYAFNIDGGGFIIVAGDDRASRVLGYNDQGQLDFSHLPDGLAWLLQEYKRQIEHLQAHPELQASPRYTDNAATVIVEPLITAHWGQHDPYNRQCPTSVNNRRTKVGCAGVQMAQICYYWQYPTSCGPMDSYTTSGLTVAALPATTFDYSKMLPSYCHWDYDKGETVLDVYDEDKIQEAAKLCRYVGQAASMFYSLATSFTNGTKKLAAMKTLGYNPNARSVSRTGNYTDEQWDEMIRAEIDAGRPVMYGAKSVTTTTSVSHAFILDGYDNQGYFHINMGWYGHGDGWYLSTAINTTTLEGSAREYSADEYIFLDMEPPVYCKILTQGIDATGELLVLGDMINIQATGVRIYTSHDAVDLAYSLVDVGGNIVATGDPFHVVKTGFEQGSNVSGTLTLPTTLSEGTYSLQFNYLADNALNIVDTATGKLTVLGKFAKYNSRFTIDDVTTVIDLLLTGTPTSTPLDISDVTMLIDHLLQH